MISPKKSWAVTDRPYSLAFVTVGHIPLLASQQGGVAASSRKYREATEADAAGVVFLFVFNRKTTPASQSAEASRHFIDRSATPPCQRWKRLTSMNATTIITHLGGHSIK